MRGECHYPDELLAYENSFSAKGAVTCLPAFLSSTASKAKTLTEDFEMILPVEFVFIRRTMPLVNL
jgi:hypothetical protein